MPIYSFELHYACIYHLWYVTSLFVWMHLNAHYKSFMLPMYHLVLVLCLSGPHQGSVSLLRLVEISRCDPPPSRFIYSPWSGYIRIGWGSQQSYFTLAGWWSHERYVHIFVFFVWRWTSKCLLLMQQCIRHFSQVSNFCYEHFSSQNACCTSGSKSTYVALISFYITLQILFVTF